jgi:hypothetical protein
MKYGKQEAGRFATTTRNIIKPLNNANKKYKMLPAQWIRIKT